MERHRSLEYEVIAVAALGESIEETLDRVPEKDAVHDIALRFCEIGQAGAPSIRHSAANPLPDRRLKSCGRICTQSWFKPKSDCAYPP